MVFASARAHPALGEDLMASATTLSAKGTLGVWGVLISGVNSRRPVLQLGGTDREGTRPQPRDARVETNGLKSWNGVCGRNELSLGTRHAFCEVHALRKNLE